MKASTFFFILAVFIFSSCASMRDDDSDATEEITNVLMTQQEEWNNGNVDGFMEAYWHNDSMMFVSGNNVSFGWQKVRDNYKKKYNSKELMGQLDFEVVHMDKLSAKSYMMVGSWNLSRASGDIGGKFSLLWKNINGKWKIVVDHTS